MKIFLIRIGFFILILSLFASAQPVLADGGVIGTPPANPDPTNPSPQYAGCGGQVAAVYNAEYEQQVINAVPKIKKFESRSSEWGKNYPRIKKQLNVLDAPKYFAYLQFPPSIQISPVAFIVAFDKIDPLT